MAPTYYEDHLAAAEKDITWINLCTLADAAVSEEEEEESLRLGLPTDNNRVFRLFPRKTRSSVSRRRNPKPILRFGESSSSSSLLPDLNIIPTHDSELVNPLQWLDSKDPQQNPRCFKRLRVTAKSQMKNPPNPNFQSRKRRAVEQRKRSGGSKKAKVDPLELSRRGRDTPESILKIMRGMNITDQEPKLTFERVLYKTDVCPGQSRLSMPISQVMFKDFLTPEEAKIIQRDINNKNKTGVEAYLVNQQSQRWDVKLKRWESEASWSYTVTCGWNDFVASNGLKVGHGISVWTFRCYGVLCFAIVPLPTMR